MQFHSQARGLTPEDAASSYRGLSFEMIRAHRIRTIDGAPIPADVLALVYSSDSATEKSK